MGLNDVLKKPDTPVASNGFFQLLEDNSRNTVDPQGYTFLQTIQLANAAHFPEIANRAGIPVLPELLQAVEDAQLAEMADGYVEPSASAVGGLFAPRSGAMQETSGFSGSLFEPPTPTIVRPQEYSIEDKLAPLQSLVPAATPFGTLQAGLRATGETIQQAATTDTPFTEIVGREFGESGQEIKQLWTDPYSEESALESYVHTLNRFIYGNPRPADDPDFEQNLFEKSFITLLGVGGDIFLDPLYFIGRVGQLGTKGDELAKVGKTLDELGIARTPEARTIERIGWYEDELGRALIGEPGSPQRLLMERIDNELGTLFIPTTPAQQARMGLRGLFNVPVFRTTPSPTFWSKMVQNPAAGRIPSLHWEPVGSRIIAPGLEVLEKRFGVTDSWTLMDLLSVSGRSAEDRAMMGFLKREIEGGQRLAIRGIRESQYVQATTTQQMQDALVKLGRQVYEAAGGQAGTGQAFDDFYREMLATINKYSEQTQVMREVSAGERAGAQVAVDPLEFTDLGKFEDPNVREFIEFVRGAQEPRQTRAQAAGLRTVDLERPDALKSLDDDAVTAYVAHMATPEAKTWLNQQRVAEGRNLVASATRKEIDAWSNTLRTRQSRGTLESYNQWFKDKYDVDWDFFQPNPAIREPARELENQRRIMSARFYTNLADNLYNESSGMYRAPIVGEPLPAGWKRVSDMMSERSLKAFDDQMQQHLQSVMLPADIEASFRRQAALIESPEALNALLDHAMHVTNWWKANTLGIFPAYHAGNAISNLYLNWLGGMWDPMMYILAGKIQSQADGVVKSWWNGKEFSYEELRQLEMAYGIRNGFVRGNVERAGQPRGFRAELLDDFERTPQGVFRAITGIDTNIHGKTVGQVIAGLLPGGQESLANRVGFGVSGRVEENARLAMFLHGLLNEGMPAEQSAARTLMALFDYSKFTREQQVAATAFPFYEFALQNTIFHLKSAVSYPARIALTPRLVEMTYPAIVNQDVDYSALPEYLQNHGLLPVGSDSVIDISRFVPFYDAYQMGGRDAPREIASHLNPGIQLLASMFIKTEDGKYAGLDLPMGAGGEAGGYNWFLNRPLAEFPGHQELYDIGGFPVELDPRTEYTFNTLFRVWGEAKRHDLLRTAIGVRVIDEDKPTTLFYELRSNQGEMDTARQFYNKALKGYQTVSDDQARTRAMALLNETLNRTELLASMYTENELPFQEGAMPAYSRDPQQTTQYRVLHEIGNLIAGTEDNPQYGALYLSAATGDQELQKALWSAYAENIQQQVSTLTVYAQTFPATEEGNDNMRSLYDTALNVIERGMEAPGAGLMWKAAHYNLWLDTLEDMAGIPGVDAHARASNFAERHRDVYGFYSTMLEDVDAE